MICENTISTGFYFMLGKFLFDLALTGGLVAVVVLFWVCIAKTSKPTTKDKNNAS